MNNLNYHRLFLVRSYCLLGLLLFSFALSAQTAAIDLARDNFLAASPGPDQVKFANQLGRMLIRENSDSCLHYIQIARLQSKQFRLPREEAKATLNFGRFFFSKNQYDSARYYYQEALGLGMKLQDSEAGLAIMSIEIAKTYHRQGLFTPAFDHYQQAIAYNNQVLADSLTLTEAFKNAIIARNISIASNFGVMYSDMEEYEKAREYFAQTLEAQLLIKDSIDLPFSYNNLGYINLIFGCYEEALVYLRTSLALRGPEKKCENIYPLFNIGYIHAQRELYDSAYHYLPEVLDRSVICNDAKIEIKTLAALGNLQIKEGKYRQAETNLLRAQRISIAKQQKLERVDVLEALVELYKQQGKSNLAFAALESYHAVKDSLFNEENVKQLARQETAFAYEQEKQKTAIEQERTRLQFQADLQRQRLIKWIVLGILVFVISFLVFLQWSYRQKNKLVNILKEKNQQILSTQKQLIMQEKMAHLGQVSAGIAHEIKNPLNFINNFAEGSIELIDELEEELQNPQKTNPKEKSDAVGELLVELRENSADILDHGKRTDRIVNSMMDHARGGNSDKELLNINQVVDDNINLAYHGFRAREHGFQVTIERYFATDLLPVMVHPNELGRVFLNLINNAFQFTNMKRKSADSSYHPTITVSTQNGPSLEGHPPKFIEIRIQDNGPGISEEIREDIFTPFFTTNPSGNGNTGLGLSISNEIIVNGHEGRLSLTTLQGVFTEFLIELPA